MQTIFSIVCIENQWCFCRFAFYIFCYFFIKKIIYTNNRMKRINTSDRWWSAILLKLQKQWTHCIYSITASVYCWCYFLSFFNSLKDPHIGSTENARIVRRIGKNEQWRRWGTSIFRTFIHRIIACVHFICTLCGIFFLHSRLTHSLPHRSLLFMQFSIYIIIRIFVLLLFFFSSTILSQYPSAHTHTCMYTYTIMRSWTRSLLLNSWTLNTVITHMSVLCSVFCWCYFLSFLFDYFSLCLCIYFHWSCCFSFELCENFRVRCFFVSRYTLTVYTILTWKKCVRIQALCVCFVLTLMLPPLFV